MAFFVHCNRCSETAPVQWTNVDVGYWIAPADWLTVEPNVHLCPSCKKRALEPDAQPTAR